MIRNIMIGVHYCHKTMILENSNKNTKYNDETLIRICRGSVVPVQEGTSRSNKEQNTGTNH